MCVWKIMVRNGLKRGIMNGDKLSYICIKKTTKYISMTKKQTEVGYLTFEVLPLLKTD